MNARRIFSLVCELTRSTLVLLKASQKCCYSQNTQHILQFSVKRSGIHSIYIQICF